MDDIEKEYEWQPDLQKREQSTEENQVGTQRNYQHKSMGRAFTNEYEITEYDLPERVMYRSTPEAAVQATGGILQEEVEGGINWNDLNIRSINLYDLSPCR